MKRTLAILLLCFAMAGLLAACGNGNDGSGTSGTSAPSSAPSQSASGSGSTQPGAYDVTELLAPIAEAANLGATINVAEIDLKFGGVDIENFAAFAGVESQLSSQNGGIVCVIQAKPGTAAQVAQELESFRDSRMGNEDYAEFEDARLNTADSRIVTKGDYVVYAVSATGQEGGWDALDAALTAAFA